MGSKRLTPTRVGKMASKCLLLLLGCHFKLTLLLFFIFSKTLLVKTLRFSWCQFPLLNERDKLINNISMATGNNTF